MRKLLVALVLLFVTSCGGFFQLNVGIDNGLMQRMHYNGNFVTLKPTWPVVLSTSGEVDPAMIRLVADFWENLFEEHLGCRENEQASVFCSEAVRVVYASYDGWVYFEETELPPGIAGIVEIYFRDNGRIEENAPVRLQRGEWEFHHIAHEVGHVLGLEHDTIPNYLMEVQSTNVIVSDHDLSVILENLRGFDGRICYDGQLDPPFHAGPCEAE